MPQSLIIRRIAADVCEESSPLIKAFDVLNDSPDHLLVTFEFHDDVPAKILRLTPYERATVHSNASSNMSYSVVRSATPFHGHSNRYRAYNDGETSLCVPVDVDLYAAMHARAESILNESRVRVTDEAMPPDTFVYTPGPFYRAAGLFARDLLYQLEGSGRDIGTAHEVKSAVDLLALKQLRENTRVGAYTYPRGAIPDHVYPDGRYCWGPGAFYGDDTAHFHRPSMDAAMCFITLGWHYGYKASWDEIWRNWFTEKALRFSEAWHSVPRNPATGLVTQWTTPGHIGASGVTETHDAGVMWGFHDSYGFGGDDVGVSVLACNAARALADMHEHAGNIVTAADWDVIAANMRDAIREQFDPAGTLPWGVGLHAPTNASPDITAYATWSDILTPVQADAASHWFGARYAADRKTGGPADLFHMSTGCRGAVRMARKADDASPGRHVWPDMTPPHWENLTYGYQAYQDGGYWYTMSHCIAATLYRRHPAEAVEWVRDTFIDIIDGGDDHPFERIDGLTPVNNRYNASVGPVLGMGMPAHRNHLE